MSIRSRLSPMRFTPRGLIDAYDATDKFLGACLTMTNLIFDQSNPEILISRPGVTSLTSFAGFTTPGVISVHSIVGDRAYGMISTARNVNKDEPFSYNIATATFDTVSNVTNANSPTTQPTSGAWTPPTMASVGSLILVTHPGFPGGATKFGWFDITTPSAPVWNAGDTATNALPSVPTAVANFNNRAYFATGQTLPYSDVLAATTRSASSQSLTIGDTSSIRGLNGLPISTTSSGIVSALIVFKDFQIWQVTGDPVTNNLLLNYLSLNIGCSAPRSIAQSPQGLYFAAVSGPAIVDLLGTVRSVVHGGGDVTTDEPDIHVPWQNVTTASRVAGGYTATIYRINLPTIVRGVSATNDYWFDEHRRRWHGPHNFSYDSVAQYANYTVLASNANPGQLIKSEVEPSATSVYTDLGTAFSSTLQSATFPKTGQMIVKQVVESTQELASAGSPASYQLTALDEIGNTLNSAQVKIAPPGGLWGSAVWGGFNWESATNIPKTYTVPWGIPLIFKKMALYLTVTATTAVSIGTFFARYQETGYTNTP